jgi:hypothetical protein
MLCIVHEPGKKKHYDLLPYPLYEWRAILVLVDSTHYPGDDLKTLPCVTIRKMCM